MTSPPNDRPLVVIVGPTASGKSDLALSVATDHGGEIVSCDSLQVYRGLDVGSAKVSTAQGSTVRHHMIDVVDPDAAFSAAEYAQQARSALADITKRGRLAVVVGGTGLYLKALLDGLFEGPSRDGGLRRRLEALAERFGNEKLHRVLRRADSVAAGRIAPNDRLRIVRALEVYFKTGRPMSGEQARGAARLEGFRAGVFGLDPGQTALKARVEHRTHAMFDAGLLDEARHLLAAGYHRDLRPLQAIGYRQAVAVEVGEMTSAEAERAIVVETMRYAKRQRTWFRHQVTAHWFAEAGAARAAIEDFLAAGANP